MDLVAGEVEPHDTVEPAGPERLGAENAPVVNDLVVFGLGPLLDVLSLQIEDAILCNHVIHHAQNLLVFFDLGFKYVRCRTFPSNDIHFLPHLAKGRIT